MITIIRAVKVNGTKNRKENHLPEYDGRQFSGKREYEAWKKQTIADKGYEIDFTYIETP